MRRNLLDPLRHTLPLFAAMLCVLATAGLGHAATARVTAGGGHTCAVTANGGAKCWGKNSAGQLGDGTTSDRTTPISVSALASGVRQISVGGLHSCVLTSAGGVKCWGANYAGQLGDGSTTDRLIPVDVSGLTSGVVAIDAGDAHTCALTTSGGVKCWGGNDLGQLGDGSVATRTTPIDVSGLNTGVTEISAGARHTCALAAGGALKCWGENATGQLGDGTTTDRSTPVAVAGLGSGVQAVSAGELHTCALTTSGGAKCWGENGSGRLGDGTTTDRVSPVDVSGLPYGVARIAAGGVHTCVVLDAGDVECWGENGSGQLGDGTRNDSTTPVQATGLVGASAVSAGTSHTCALTGGGALKCWGDNYFAQVGDGTTMDRDAPVNVFVVADGAVAVSPGDLHTCVLTGLGGLRCWGRNAAGQLGDGTTTDRLAAVNVGGLTSNIASVSSGGSFTCALTNVGGVKCWGWNDVGQLGDGTTTSRSIPADVSGLTSGVQAISAGFSHVCALMISGTVKCWGRNDSGQLGDGTTTDRLTPVDVSGLVSVAALSAGAGHTCALTTGGGLKCWGNNDYAQLGDGTKTSRVAPVDVSGLTADAVSISSGGRHSCAVTGAGGAKCWGANYWGQVGDGTAPPFYQPQLVPADVIGLTTGVTSVSAGAEHSCALTSAGSVKCWGNNDSEQLGNGETGNYHTAPVDVAGPLASVVFVAAGSNHTCAVTSGGGVKCWGRNVEGELGSGTTTASVEPLDSFGVTGATTVVAGLTHACVLTASGGVKCWGSRLAVGSGALKDRLTAVDVTGLASGVIGIAAGGFHTCAVTSAGGAKCWGSNTSGALGNGSTIDSDVPVDVSALSEGVAKIAAGYEFTCALTSAGAVKCWGRNDRGQLGDGSAADQLTAVQVGGLTSGVVAIAAGLYHACALTNEGAVKCWGYDGSTASLLTPVDVSGLSSGVVAISAGGFHSCALTSLGGVKCWGFNGYGELGDGSSTRRSFASDVIGLTDGVVAIAVGQHHTCALSVDGGMQCWGKNYSGQLGDGSGDLVHLSPVGVIGLTRGVVAIGAGGESTCAVISTGGARCWGSNFRGALGDGSSVYRYTPVSTHECGDGTKEPGEACDDGNTIGGDCCAERCDLGSYPSCQVESRTIDAGGGTLTTPDGATSITIPPNALAGATAIDVAGNVMGSFNLGTSWRSARVVALGPSGQTFAAPVTVSLSWQDLDDNGIEDGTSSYEAALVVFHNGTPVTGQCGDLIYRPGICTTTCCDALHNTWTFQTSSFSEFAAAAGPCSEISGAQLKLTKLDRPAANGLSFKAEMLLSAAQQSALDPVADGIRIRMTDGSAEPIDMIVPGGAYDRVAKKGWKVNGTGTTWTYIGAIESSPLPGLPRTGVRKVVLKRSATSGRLKIQVTGKNGSYSVAPPPTIDVVLPQGGCFQASFPGSPSPGCLYNGTQTTLVCR